MDKLQELIEKGIVYQISDERLEFIDKYMYSAKILSPQFSDAAFKRWKDVLLYFPMEMEKYLPLIRDLSLYLDYYPKMKTLGNKKKERKLFWEFKFKQLNLKSINDAPLPDVNAIHANIRIITRWLAILDPYVGPDVQQECRKMNFLEIMDLNVSVPPIIAESKNYKAIFNVKKSKFLEMIRTQANFANDQVIQFETENWNFIDPDDVNYFCEQYQNDDKPKLLKTTIKFRLKQ